MSDTIPMCGKHRMPYLLMCGGCRTEVEAEERKRTWVAMSASCAYRPTFAQGGCDYRGMFRGERVEGDLCDFKVCPLLRGAQRYASVSCPVCDKILKDISDITDKYYQPGEEPKK